MSKNICVSESFENGQGTYWIAQFSSYFLKRWTVEIDNGDVIILYK